MPSLRFWVEGTPQPQGSKTAGNRKDGSAFLRDKNPRPLKEWRTTVIEAIHSQLPDWWEDKPIDVGIIVRLVFWMPRPKSAPKTIDVRPITRPDIDKLLRAVLDSMTMSKLIKDDAIVHDVIMSERYSVTAALPKIFIPGFHQETPGVEITVSWASV